MSKSVVRSPRLGDSADAKVAALDPEVEAILGPPALLDGEDPVAYAGLHSRVRAAVAPADFIEELWVRDVADLTWEALRLRRFKAKLMGTDSPRGLRSILKTLEPNPNERESLIRGWATGVASTKKKVDQLLKQVRYDRATETFSDRIDDFERIDHLIMQTEARRNSVLREIDRHRDTVGRRLRDAVADVEDAEFEEIAAHGDEVVA